ncbi:MAG TPA: folylpolyglutamate synthase/dihydrofolate synthase family protein [Candidatus Dormibacteraeota bacterium]|nr:folylpolyglutamate synthase/dihydrofolate synthase family protein [Candidatus Dormibacteraeota bacterium]
MNYETAVRYLLSLGRELAAPTQASAAKFDLQNITVLAERLGRPDRAYPTVHIAGTNGKGSTAAFLEAILRDAGFRTGLNTSPHLERINERIWVEGEEVSDEVFAETFTRVQAVIEELLAEGKLRAHPTYFESVTALAFEIFARARVEFGVIEVGLGGRLDATNIVEPVVTIITRIDFDHENFLGHSLREIAVEKAGILKPAVPVVIAAQQPEVKEVLVARAQELRCAVLEASEAFRVQGERVEEGCVRAIVKEMATGRTYELAPRLSGRFQLQNALNAVAAARLLQEHGYRISDENIVRGIAATEWPGRIERLGTRPDVYLDGAHNPGAAKELAAFLEENFRGRKVYLVFGAMRDKAVDEVTGALFPQAYEVLFTEARTPRAISAAQLARMAGHHAERYTVYPEAESALEAALEKAKAEDAVFITGSLYLVGELRKVWKQRRKVASG